VNAKDDDEVMECMRVYVWDCLKGRCGVSLVDDGGKLGSSASAPTMAATSTATASPQSADAALAPASTASAPPPSADAALAPEDHDFVDTRSGAGWGDRCWKHLQAGRLAYAKAACDRAMEMNPASPQPRASLLYNQGLIQKKLGNADAARSYFGQSLALRPNADVQAALDGLDR
jgi:tetratricopeptide (TPR) repeat protein